jgi:hypothetical protein
MLARELLSGSADELLMRFRVVTSVFEIRNSARFNRPEWHVQAGLVDSENCTSANPPDRDVRESLDQSPWQTSAALKRSAQTA